MATNTTTPKSTATALPGFAHPAFGDVKIDVATDGASLEVRQSGRLIEVEPVVQYRRWTTPGKIGYVAIPVGHQAVVWGGNDHAPAVVSIFNVAEARLVEQVDVATFASIIFVVAR